MSKYLQFPFDKIPSGNKFAFYGAGNICKLYLRQLRAASWLDGLVAIVDRNWEKMKQVEDIPVISPDELTSTNFEFVVVAAQERFHSSIAKELDLKGIPKEKIVYPKNSVDISGLATATPQSPWGRLSYSFHAEDFVVLFTFRALGIEKPGYIDVGAFDPYIASNTALMYLHGSRGINVEANPNHINAFLKERPEDINLNIGVGVNNETLPFYVFGDDDTSSTFSIEQVKLLEKNGNVVSRTIDVEVLKLDTIIEKYANGVYPEFLNIDAEGLDYDVLKSANFSENTPKIICCEVKDEHPLSEMSEMLSEKGYELYVVLSDDAIYLKKGLKEKLKIMA